MKHFEKDELVRFAPGFCSETEKDRQYRIIECFDDVQRAKIVPAECSLPIIPVESVS